MAEEIMAVTSISDELVARVRPVQWVQNTFGDTQHVRHRLELMAPDGQAFAVSELDLDRLVEWLLDIGLVQIAEE